jgi:hypothetical protein
MILFKEWHIQPILRGHKTQTRRVWDKPRARVGAVHLAKTQMLSTDYFAKLLITGIRKEKLCQITPEDSMKEGGYSVPEFIDIWKQINDKWDPDLEVTVIDFELGYSDIKKGDIVVLSKECAEHSIHGDVHWNVLDNPWWIPGNEMVCIESNSKIYSSFATKFLEKVSA